MVKEQIEAVNVRYVKRLQNHRNQSDIVLLLKTVSPDSDDYETVAYN